MVKFGATFKPSQQLSLEFAKLAIFSDFGTLCVFKKPYIKLKSTNIDQQLASIMQNGPQETINLPPGAQNFLTHLAFFLMRDHCGVYQCCSIQIRVGPLCLIQNIYQTKKLCKSMLLNSAVIYNISQPSTQPWFSQGHESVELFSCRSFFPNKITNGN